MTDTGGARDGPESPDRRRFLKAIGALGVAGLAGCGGDGGTGPTRTDTAGRTATPTTTGAQPPTGDTTRETPTDASTPGETETGTATPTEEPTPTPTEPPDPSAYTRTVVSDRMSNLIDLAVTPDGRVLYVTRGAAFHAAIEDTVEIGVVEETGDGEYTDTVALELPAFVGLEDGGMGIGIDPAFEENGWVYVYYSPTNEAVAGTDEEREYLDQAGGDRSSMARPPSESIGNPYNRLSRFTLRDGSIGRDTEVEILRVPVQRDVCCHPGGAIEFGPEGYLYLTTGDNTYALASADPGTAPLDEREDRDYFDAQRTAADTSDLRGKILRIDPGDDGTYTVPDDNLFTEAGGYGEEIDDGIVRPEIYAMGLRNPYQAAVDGDTGAVFWCDFAADAREWHPDRGPPGFNEFARATSPGNYGWPYFTGPYPYVDYDYATGKSGDPFDPGAPTNDSTNSGGLTELPPLTSPVVWYPSDWGVLDQAPGYVDLVNDGAAPFPSLEGAGPICGPLVRFESGFEERGLHAFYDGHLFIAEWERDWIKTVSFEGDVTDGAVAAVRPFLPDTEFDAPIAMEVGPEGSLYVAEYGGTFGAAESRISRITRA